MTPGRVELSPLAARRIRRRDGWITIRTSDETTVTSQEGEQVASRRADGFEPSRSPARVTSLGQKR